MTNAVAAGPWISPTGRDSNDGSRASLQTSLTRDPAAPVFVLPGSDSVPRPVVLEASNAGAIIEAAAGIPPVFTGGLGFTGFSSVAIGLWRTEAEFRFGQFQVHG